MLLTTLVQTAAGYRHASHTFRALAPIAYRTLFYPSAPPPSPDLTRDAKFPPEGRAHLSKEQFISVLDSQGSSDSSRGFGGLLPEGTLKGLRVGNSTPEETWVESSTRFAESRLEPPGLYKGRTVFVRKGDDLGEKYAKLQAILRNNNVRKELRLTERHEKKGAKRRRLCSERWRRKFADEVRKKVKLVSEIRLRDRMWGARH